MVFKRWLVKDLVEEIGMFVLSVVIIVWFFFFLLVGVEVLWVFI